MADPLVLGGKVERPAHLSSPMRSGYAWLTRTSSRETPEMRAWMLASVASQSTPVWVGSLAVAATAAGIVTLTGALWPLVWLAFDLTITAIRLVIIAHVNKGGGVDDSHESHHAILTALGVAWSAAFGAAAFLCVRSGVPAVMVLAALNVAGMVGVTATRNCATPRYAVLAMLLAAVPFAVGANGSPVGGMMTVAIITALMLAGMISLLLQNNRLLVRTYRAEQRAHRLAMTDGLSGLSNRKSLQDKMRALTKDWRDGKRHRQSFLYLDLDGFKLINDEHGHIAGDLLLAAVARRLRAAIRSSDLLYRPGGDEFVILMPGSDDLATTATAQRIIAACSQPFEIQLSAPVRIGVSVGSATSVSGGLAPLEALAAADKALYAAKHAGKGVYRRHPVEAKAAA